MWVQAVQGSEAQHKVGGVVLSIPPVVATGGVSDLSRQYDEVPNSLSRSRLPQLRGHRVALAYAAKTSGARIAERGLRTAKAARTTAMAAMIAAPTNAARNPLFVAPIKLASPLASCVD